MFLEFDSSSVMVRAVASTLKGEEPAPIKVNPLMSIMLRVLKLGGRRFITKIVAGLSGKIGVELRELSRLSSETAAEWSLSHYDEGGKFRTLVVGAPSGAAAHLSTMLKAPFLTQHFLVGVRHPHTHPDDVERIVGYGLKAAEEIRRRDRSLEVIIHYDPVHDRLLSGRLNTIRVKLTGLPESYRRFMDRRLEREATILFLDVKYPWKQLVLDENIHLQVGGLGGIRDEEYLYGSERLDRWLREQGSQHTGGWIIESYDVEELPESEWGTYPGLREEVREYAEENGHNFMVVEAEHPENISEVVAEVFANKLGEGGRMFFDCFTAIDPKFNITTSTIPVWMPFNCHDSYEFAREFLTRHRDIVGGMILFTLAPNFIETPDQVKFREWLSLFSEYAETKVVAVNPKLYPTDISHIYRFPKEIAELSVKWYNPLEEDFSPQDVMEYLSGN